jgi:hypothetical protein
VKLRRSLVAAAAVTAVLAAVPLVHSGSALAATPPWEPDPNAAGTLTFYDATGNVKTSGHLSDLPFASYAVGSADIRTGDTKATLYAATPNSSLPTGSWSSGQLTASTTYPNPAAPGPVGTSTHPVVSLGAGDGDLTGYIAQFPNTDANPAYQNIYQLRVKTSKPGLTATSMYLDADIMVNTAAGTWTQVYPASAAVSTTTALAVSPPSPQAVGTTVTLTATVTPSGAAGSVQFFDGATAIGTPVAVSGGTATRTTSTLTAGTHSLKATFTPTSSAAFTSSTSSVVSYTISAGPTTTTTALAVTPASPQVQGTTLTLKATLTPSAAVGSVQFFDGASTIGSPVAVSGGIAQTPTTALTVGSHTLKATFTPTDANAFTTSTSSTVSYTITAPATSTTTTLGVLPASPQQAGTALTFTGTVAPATAAGSVQFLDGATVLGSGTVSGGVATFSTSSLAVGSHTLTAKFVPTNPATFGPSTSAAVPYTITPAPATDTTTTLTVSPPSGVTHGTTVNLTATVTPTAAAGTVTFKDGTTTLGSKPLASGTATFPIATLAVGSHTLTASFTPTNPGQYNPSASLVVPYDVVNPPPGATTTTLTAAPASPVVAGTSVTFTATVAPTAAAGSVELFDGATSLGSKPVAAGKATFTTTTLTVASHDMKAVFTPTDATTWDPSTSATLTYVVKAPATATTTALAVMPASPVVHGTSVTMTATVTPSAAAGTVSFFDGATQVGSSPVGAGGTATFTTTALSIATHSLKATFVPTDATAFAGSSSAVVSYVVQKAPATTTTTTLVVTPGSSALQGTAVTLTATVAPSNAVGSVVFYDGTFKLATVALSGGSAHFTTKALSAGSHTLSASFVPTDATAFAPSTSASVAFTVTTGSTNVPPATLTVTGPSGSVIHPGATLHVGDQIVVAGSGFNAGEKVTVTLHSATITLGTVVADGLGNVRAVLVIPAALEVGTHTVVLTGKDTSGTFGFVVVAAAPSASPTPSTAPSSGSGSGDDLAHTGGGSLAPAVTIGLTLLGLGFVAVMTVRRRRRVS